MSPWGQYYLERLEVHPDGGLGMGYWDIADLGVMYNIPYCLILLWGRTLLEWSK